MNTLYLYDNLYVLYGLDSKSVDLIYIDPPFNSKGFYSAPVGSKSAGVSFNDMWTWDNIDEYFLKGMIVKYPSLVKYIEAIEKAHSSGMKAYLTYMSQRLIEMHRVLKDTGSFYLHCDQYASHYLKIVLDFIFGKNNFRNEIIWERSPPGKGGKKISKQLSRDTDIILFYSKNNNMYYYNKPFITDSKNFPEKVLKEFRYKEQGTNRKYKIVRLGNYTKENIEKFRKQNLIHITNKGTDKEKEYKKYYLDEFKLTIGNIWFDIKNITHGKNPEYTGYPTQKPVELLHRIIKSSSKVGDVVLDAFCGCATTCVASQQLGRKWIGIDVAERTSEILTGKLNNNSYLNKIFITRKDTPIRSDVEKINPKNKELRKKLYGEQGGYCNGCKKHFHKQNLTVDHIIPTSRGGGDFYENYQMLCNHCNSVKGNKPMEYLLNKVDKMKKQIEENTY